MKLLGIIPARHASTRLPGKPLLDIGGRSMVMRVWDGALRSKSLADLVVATDDERIVQHVIAHGGKALLTSAEHPSGTDRCHEALVKHGGRFDAVVNVQGDEPFIDPRQIDQVCEVLSDPTVAIATLAAVINNDRDIDDPGEAKIIVDHAMNALYFSRAPIPQQHIPSDKSRADRFRYLKHVGLYAYRTSALERIVQLPPSALELAESLEQLRWLEAGFRIRVGITDIEPFCVDTQADLEEARRRVEAA